jgi:hypothetical protein
MTTLLLVACIQAAEIGAVERELTETWGPLLVEVETAALAVEDLQAELKPSVPDADRERLKAFREEHDGRAREERIRARAKGVAGFPADPEGRLKAVREGYAAAKRRHAALLASDKAAAIRWTERQIGELYAPLVRLNAQGLAAVRGYTRLNPDDTEQVRWKVWAEREFLPRNEETRRVLAAGFALLEGEGPSDSVRAFLVHQHSWAMRHLRWQKEKGAYDWGSRTNWPVDFSKEIEASCQKLLDLRARLVAGEK